MRDPSRRTPYRGQRALDLACVGLLSPAALLVGAAAAAAIRLDSDGPVLFVQERVGRHGEPFRVFKFRTMVHVDDQSLRLPGSHNVTRVGRLLRRSSLDELPQLLNVLRGEMSVVGPRPTLQYQVDRYSPRQRRRLDVRPGLTGLAQVSGRNALRWEQRIELDLEYVDSQTLAGDLKILVRTLAAVVRGEGVAGHDADDPFVRGASS